ncbi:MAG: response regulator transcription factor [SAR202 cluster bacterium]|nr:response regulator transcription factor [SAR202 cluster bacterium]
MDRKNVVRVLIAEDHDLVRRCLGLTLARRAEFQLVGEASTAAQAKEMVAQLQPDVVVVDVALPDETGVATARAIRARHPGVRVLVLTSHSDDRAVICSIMAGALGYLLKEIRSREIVDALRRAGEGRRMLDQALAQRVLERLLAAEARDQAYQLTQEERQVLNLAARGLTDLEIAQELELPESAVARDIDTILDKLELNRRAQVAAYLTESRARRGAFWD